MLPMPSDDLIERYSRPGPRYTSYPPATAWSGAVGEDAARGHLARANESATPLSLYVHIPFCPEMCHFCGCNMIATKNRAKGDDYLDTLEKEVALWAEHLPRQRTFSQLHLGGGTPTFLEVNQLRRLHEILTRHFHPVPGAELAIEVDPAVTTEEQLAVLGEQGFNRVSVGIQDLDPQVQVAINRIQGADATHEVIRAARRSGFESVNVDLMYGLPHQTPEKFVRTLERVLAMEPDRMALFGYAHVPWMKPNQRLLPQAHIPGPRQRVELFVTAARILEQAGFIQIGLDHFARADDALARAKADGTLSRNFQGYVTGNPGDTLALGMSGISDLAGGFFQSSHRLAQWREAVDDGRLPIERGLVRTEDDDRRGGIIRTLMCLLRLDREEIRRELGERAADIFDAVQPDMKAFEADGLVHLEPGRMRVTELGTLFLRNIAMVFDAYLGSPGRPAFSRTV